MQKVRVHEIARELGIKSKDVVEKAIEAGLDVKTASSAVEPEVAEQLIHYVITGKLPESTQPKTQETPSPTPLPASAPKTEVIQEVEPVKTPPLEAATITPPPPSPRPIEESPDEPEEVQESIMEPLAQEQNKKETLAQATVSKRRGLMIVKKKRVDEVVVEEEPPRPAAPKRLDVMLETPTDLLKAREREHEEQERARRKKKAKKPVPGGHKKELGQKIDLLAERDLSGLVEVDEEEEEVMLMDLSSEASRLEREEAEEEERKKREERIKVTRQNPFFQQQGIRRSSRRKRRRREEVKEEVQGVIEIPEDVRVYEFADKVGKSTGEVVKVLFNLGVMVTKNDFLDNDALEILAEEFGVEIVIKNPLEALDYMATYEEIEDEEEELCERPPVVTIMGHVDHGKTSLLDKIRNSRVAAGEAGGITQHIGAYMVEKNGKKISFIDTPGHEAFTEMRSRGAQVTDIAIIVVAADDGVQPQTKEALSHAKAAEVPIIIAVNKIDKPEANPDMAKSQMAELGYSPIEWGGEYEFVHVSAKTGEGIETLLETILLQAEILELVANPNREAKAVIVESSLEKGKGPVATVIIQNGTLHVGDSVVVDTEFGRVRALIDDLGRQIPSIGPSEMAVLTGLSGVPVAGSILVAVEDDATARDFAQKRAEHKRQKELSKSTKVSFDELSAMVAEGQLKVLNVIIKSDVQGSLEAIKGSLEKIKNEEVRINVVLAAVGGVSESDLALASASENNIILGFNVRPTGVVKEKAKVMGVQIKTYSIIYDLLDDVRALVFGMMSPLIEEEATGQAEVRDTFVVSKVGTIAGCMVTDGTIQRGIKVRLIRDGVVTHTTTIASLKRFKDDAREVSKGYECGIMLEGYNDIRVGDVFETFKEVQRKRTL